MKKTLILAALAGTVLAGCMKTEPVSNTAKQDEISFLAPVLTPASKADEITADKFPQSEHFIVQGWHNEATFDAATATSYMTEVEVEYSSDHGGCWKNLSTPYYWPKKGVLSFEAYYPTSLKGSVSFAGSTKNMVITGYTAPNDYATQKDVLYSDRTLNKTASSGGTDYNGVDINFHHALSVLKIKVKAASAEAANVIKVKSITVNNIQNNGTFTRENTGNEWALADGTVNYAATTAATDYDNSTAITTTEAQYGNNMIVMPQSFDADKEITIVYYMKNGGEDPLEQTYTFELSSTDHTDGTNQIEKWEMGKRYTYNITFGVEEIYFSPELDAWADVNVTVPTIQ